MEKNSGAGPENIGNVPETAQRNTILYSSDKNSVNSFVEIFGSVRYVEYVHEHVRSSHLATTCDRHLLLSNPLL